MNSIPCSLLIALLINLTHFAAVATAESGDLLERKPIQVDSSIIPDSFPEEHLAAVNQELRELAPSVVIERIVYESQDLRVTGFLAQPQRPGPYPCVIFNRGGNRDFGALSPLRATLSLGTLAQHGYVVVASQYRGVDGGEGIEEFGGAEVVDVLNLIPLLETLPEADADRLGMYGWSRGGMMTYLALTRTDRIRAAVIGAAPTDLAAMIADRPEMETHVLAELVPDWGENREAAIEARSAIRWPEQLPAETPVLLLHGSSDWRVLPTESIRMTEALYRLKRPVRLVFFEGGDHGLTEYREEVDEQIIR